MSLIIIVLLVLVILNMNYIYRSGIKPMRDTLKGIDQKLDKIQNQ